MCGTHLRFPDSRSFTSCNVHAAMSPPTMSINSEKKHMNYCQGARVHSHIIVLLPQQNQPQQNHAVEDSVNALMLTHAESLPFTFPSCCWTLRESLLRPSSLALEWNPCSCFCHRLVLTSPVAPRLLLLSLPPADR